MDLGLAGKVAWVNGASSGLGRASAAALAAEGAFVAVSARREDELAALAGEIENSGGRAVAVPLDVTDREAIATAAWRVADELGPVDILVANGGGPPPGGFADFGDDDLHAGFTLTTASAWRLAKTVVPSMQERKTGCLIFLTSGSTKEIIPTLLLSNMMRAAVTALAKTLAKELAPDGIRVLCAAPGRIHTPRLVALDNSAAERAGTDVEQVRANITAGIPLGRYGEPEEFGEVVAFLASERASYVNGVTVTIDGGALNGLLS